MSTVSVCLALCSNKCGRGLIVHSKADFSAPPAPAPPSLLSPLLFELLGWSLELFSAAGYSSSGLA